MLVAERSFHFSLATCPLAPTYLLILLPESQEESISQCIHNCIRVIKEGHMDAIKLEGGVRRKNEVAALSQCGIAVQGHIGLTPQSIGAFGGFKVQGKTCGIPEIGLICSRWSDETDRRREVAGNRGLFFPGVGMCARTSWGHFNQKCPYSYHRNRGRGPLQRTGPSAARHVRASRSSVEEKGRN